MQQEVERTGLFFWFRVVKVAEQVRHFACERRPLKPAALPTDRTGLRESPALFLTVLSSARKSLT